jgi:Tfp pilus assembly major pilin PilA
MFMTYSFPGSQRGFSLFGMLFVAIVLAVTGVIAAQVAPTAIEYQAVIKAAQKASEGNTVVEVRNIFDKVASIDNISSINGKDIDVTKENDKVVVSFAYQREIHLVGPAFLTLKYVGRSR